MAPLAQLLVLDGNSHDESAPDSADHWRPPRSSYHRAHGMDLVVDQNHGVCAHFSCVPSQGFLDFFDLRRRINRGVHNDFAEFFVWSGRFTAQDFYLCW